jgi:hypothetical protein
MRDQDIMAPICLHAIITAWSKVTESLRRKSRLSKSDLGSFQIIRRHSPLVLPYIGGCETSVLFRRLVRNCKLPVNNMRHSMGPNICFEGAP